MTKTQLQEKLAKQIIFTNLALIIIVIIYYLMKGFDQEELASILALLTAISAIYIGTLMKYIGKIIKTNDKNETNTTEQTIPHSSIVKWIVPVHFIILLLLISAKAFAFIPFKTMNIFLTFIEASFGGSIGYIIGNLFNIEEK